MSARERPASTIDALTDKELEILRMLTAGHTVKSIASRLGRSETSINERLRDARRKTGIGSSRELARHVAAQKNWNKKFDLSTHGSATDQELHPKMAGWHRSKGTVVMLIALALAAAGIAFAPSERPNRLAPAQESGAAASDRAPLVTGRWSLDTSRLPPEGRPQSVFLDFRVSSDQVWTGQSDIVEADGNRQHAEATGPADGVPVPVTGNMSFADMVSMRQPAPNTLVLTFTKGGVPVSTRVYTVEGDRMKETIIWAGDITPRMVTTYFDRVG